eukprot:350910-Chlamydomonas_euryale.AAC.6
MAHATSPSKTCLSTHKANPSRPPHVFHTSTGHASRHAWTDEHACCASPRPFADRPAACDTSTTRSRRDLVASLRRLQPRRRDLPSGRRSRKRACLRACLWLRDPTPPKRMRNDRCARAQLAVAAACLSRQVG